MFANETDWPNLGIECPSCGNRGNDDALWAANGPTPFRLVEDVARSWTFTARFSLGIGLIVVANASQDEIDWESGSNRRFECMQCLTQFPLPSRIIVSFE